MLDSFVKIKNFKLSVPDIGYLTDTKNMDAVEKYDILKKWIGFLSNHFKSSTFNKKLYKHLSNHCGYIAHYNQNGFYGNYFGTPAQFHWLAFGTKKNATEYDGYAVGGNYVGVNAIESKEAFVNIWKEVNLSRRAYVNDEGLGGFFYGWNGLFHCHEDYRDLNRAMQMVYEEYVETWEKLLAEAEEKRIREEIKEQRVRVTKTLIDAAIQLEQIERAVPVETPKKKKTAQLSLLDFLFDDDIAV
jgi:hypothetical protein